MLRHLWWVVGLALVVGGTALALLVRPDPAQFGWFAYTPLDHAPAARSAAGPTTTTVSPWQLLGASAAVLGLLVVAAGVGFRLGRRGRQAG